MGVETEFGVAAYDGARQALTPEEVARYLFRHFGSRSLCRDAGKDLFS